ncbi:hypothetical protein DPMN_115368 [Dreissena polymorpha]|uniref:Uncharacterized protein n=1 Tax=Dreissena polymorpha TaxID=45954 RepID=A0A9D4KKK0_DREPO|nr:hypothetical protein DPMN_115083 [Dreissena polymorpha]KAH3841886.1 hypothetical protein DPMN_115368 [Dreissena polymorpha]
MVSAVLCEDNMQNIMCQCGMWGICYVCDKGLVYDVNDSCEEDDSDGKDGEDGDNDDGDCGNYDHGNDNYA